MIANDLAARYHLNPQWVRDQADRDVVAVPWHEVAALLERVEEARGKALIEAAEIAARMYAGTDGNALERAWIGGCQATERAIRNRAASIGEQGAR